MEHRRLGNCGTSVSALGLGGWITYGGSMKDASAVEALLRKAFDAGVNFFDMADVYAKGQAETVMGRALSGLPRHRLVLSSKVFWPMSDDVNDRGLSRKHVLESADASLRRIGTDYLDIYFCHRHDPETPLEETARAMDHLVRAGKILYWGTSEWSGAQLKEARALCRAGGWYAPQVEQPELSLLSRTRFERDVSPVARELGMGLVTWSPLASGLLSGKYDEAPPAGSRLAQVKWLDESIRTPENVRRVRAMKDLAARAGCTRAQLALAWVLSRPGVSSVITGATSAAQLDENLGTLKVKVDPDVLDALDGIFPRS